MPPLGDPLRSLLFLVLLALPAQAVELVELLATDAVVDRRPAGPVSTYAESGQVYIYLTAQNREAPTRIRVVWFREDRLVVADAVRVGTADAWRTWLRRRLRPGDAGVWRVEVQSEAGAVLGSTTFQVGDPQAVDPQADSPAAELPAEPEPAEPEPAEPEPAEPEPAEPEPAEPEPAEPEPAEPEPAEPETAAPESAPPKPPAASALPCRVLLNLRTSPPEQAPRYAVAELRFGTHAELDATTGLVQRTERGLELLWTLLREDAVDSAHGRVERQWDELWSLPLAGGTPRVRVALPATLGPPEREVAEPTFREENRLEVLSILGPWIGLHAHLTGVAEAGPFDKSRLLTLGNPNDLKTLIGEGLVELAQDAASEAADAVEDRIVGVPLHDFRQAAVVVGAAGLEVWARLLCCQQKRRPGGLPIRIALHAPPPPLRPYALDSQGLFHHDGCAVGLDGPRIVARARPRDPLRVVPAPGVVPFGVLGVVWLDPAEPFALSQVDAAAARLLRTP